MFCNKRLFKPAIAYVRDMLLYNRQDTGNSWDSGIDPISCFSDLTGFLFNLGFSQTHNIGNNVNIGIRGFIRSNQKKSSDKILPSVRIEPRPLIPSSTLSFLR